MNSVSKQTFQQYDTEAKLDTLYEYTHAIWKEMDKLKVWKPLNPIANLIGGAVGGALTVLTWIKFFR
jgi:hypothetical protein